MVTSSITPNTRLEGCLFLQTTAQVQDVMEVFRTLTWLVPYYYSFHLRSAQSYGILNSNSLVNPVNTNKFGDVVLVYNYDFGD